MTHLVSTGGLGDAFLVALKIQKWLSEYPEDEVDWLHVESNDLSKPMSELLKLFKFENVHFGFDHDEDYIRHLSEHLEGRVLIPTPVRGECNFHKCKWELDDPFLKLEEKPKEFDIILQASGGFNNEREWKNHPVQIAEALAGMGHHVTLVGTGTKYATPSNKPDKYISLVNRTKLTDVLEMISRCNLFIGMSGLLNYFACAARIPNIHVIESEDHERIYYHPDWNKYTKGIKFGALPEVIRVIRLLEKEEVL